MVDQGGASGTLNALTSALKNASSSPRFFRSIQQWTASFLRYAIVAEALGQTSRAWSLNHLMMVTRLAEEQRLSEEGTPFLALVYDDLRRRNWASRAERKDSSLDILKESALRDEPILLAAKQRLGQVLSAAGVLSGGGVAQSILQKQSEAASALTARAEQAAKALASQQQGIENRERALRSQGSGDSWAAETDHPMNSREKKSKKFFEKIQQKNWEKKGAAQNQQPIMPWQSSYKPKSHKGGGKAKGKGKGKGKGKSGW
jgi:hypothetical protein